MTKALSVERVYSLSPYNTLRLTDDTIISDEHDHDDKYVALTRLLQFLSIERDYRKYLQIFETLNKMPTNEAIQAINEMKENVYKELVAKEIKND